jgi:uncharacterized protein YjiS (DUF1127 family)
MPHVSLEDAMTTTVMTAASARTNSFDARGLFASAAGLVGRLYRVWHNRTAVAVLDAVSDHMLADIGLTRSDLRDALNEPLWRDPTQLMSVRARRLGNNA